MGEGKWLQYNFLEKMDGNALEIGYNSYDDPSTVKTGSSPRAGPDRPRPVKNEPEPDQTIFYAGFYGLVRSGSRAGPQPPLSHSQSQSVSSLGSLYLSFFFNFDFFFRNPQQTTAAADDPHLSPLFTNNRHLPQLRFALLVHCAAPQQHRHHTLHPPTTPLHANSLATTSQTW
ncbi:hypothetical protein M9H77_23479 [Catharanthus roseus]|uniref:Uncharacterized protein n=1 Tax=Catharanthus roseus TaxID=4058 RepID=A0ACC0AXH5_CATRO|nr:hypothetical protein M9H77_23479 [Catharanthus roseus]